ncbi:hypothetical protein Vretifemale_1795 [Volvox reticuliferus]|uniref:Uncharacterized protein n=1 Tax=Volvox reticuliferus TaxID=1737510 RepID=A0A8J4FE67_9CHLO|nr:hypothetical protein Vretifemale_1795 [Volvox reticuliferus]
MPALDGTGPFPTIPEAPWLSVTEVCKSSGRGRGNSVRAGTPICTRNSGGNNSSCFCCCAGTCCGCPRLPCGASGGLPGRTGDDAAAASVAAAAPVAAVNAASNSGGRVATSAHPSSPRVSEACAI